MKIVLVATKDLKLWHIKGQGDMTMCGIEGTQMPTDPKDQKDLPDNKKNYCLECLKKLEID